MSELMTALQSGLSDLKQKVNASTESNEAAIKGLRNEMADVAQKGLTPLGYSTTTTKTASALVVEDPAMQAMIERKSRSASVPMNITIKSLVGDVGNTTGNSVYPVQPQRGSVVGNDARRRLSLLDVLPTLPATSGSYEFVSLDGFTNAAAIQAQQGDTKATQAMAFELKTATIATIAALLPMSEQVLADAPGLGMFIQDKMGHAALDKLEAELIGGTGGTGAISGLKSQATAFTATATNLPDSIGEAIAELDGQGYSAGVVVMSPADWQTIRAERATDGQYVAGGWADGAAPSIWGVPVVTSSSLAADEVLVFDTAQVALLDRQSPRFEFGYVDSGFAENVIVGRMELRAGIAVFSPSAVLSVTVGI